MLQYKVHCQPLSTSQSSCTSDYPRPRPILIKLNCPWDRWIVLAGKKKRLSSISGMETYLLQPDLPNARNAEMHIWLIETSARDPLLLIHNDWWLHNEKLLVVSFNCHGYHNGLSCIPVLLESFDTILLQEYWLSDSELGKLCFDGLLLMLYQALITRYYYMGALLVVVPFFIVSAWLTVLSLLNLYLINMCCQDWPP